MKYLKITMVGALTATYLSYAQLAQAQTMLFFDDFSSGNDNRWWLLRNTQPQPDSPPCLINGVPASWQILNGRYGITIDGPGCTTEVSPINLNLANRNYEFEFDWYMAEQFGMDRGVVFLWQNVLNWYGIRIFNDYFTIQKTIDGQKQQLGNPIHYPFVHEETFHFKIQVLEENTIRIFINNELIATYTDSVNFPAGFRTVALQGVNGTNKRSASYFDNVKVSSVDLIASPLPSPSPTPTLQPSPLPSPTQQPSELSLNVPLFKQTDSKWAHLEYDSAKKWSTIPTIKQWGCALSSIAMVMKHHGLHNLPDGQQLTPDTLNQWLKSQKDGYLNGGLVNWQAITRLTYLISQRYQTPKLEYRRTEGSSFEKAISEISAQKPVILQIAGHFLVGKGTTNNKKDLLINDPFYSYEKFSQHKTSLLSTRTFQPSQTDLSYLLITHQPGLNVVLKDADGKNVPMETYSESLKAAENQNQTSPTLVVRQVPQPRSGVYSLSITQPQFGQYSLQVFAYDAKGGVIQQELSGVVGPSATEISVTYSSTGSSKVIPTTSWSQFRNGIRALLSQGHIKQKMTYQILDQLIVIIQHLQPRLQAPAIALLRSQIKEHERWFTPVGRQYLNQQLKTLQTNQRLI